MAILLSVFWSGCDQGPSPDPSLERLAVFSIQPSLFVPGSEIVVEGTSFVGMPWGEPSLHLEGTYEGHEVDAQVPLTFVNYERMTVSISDELLAELGLGSGVFEGEAHVDIESQIDGRLYESVPLDVRLEFVEKLKPELGHLAADQLLFVNDSVFVEGQNFLLGGEEGQTFARLVGCFTGKHGLTCEKRVDHTVPVVPVGPYDRETGEFSFSPAIAGMREGAFHGEVEIFNRHRDGTEVEGGSQEVAYDIIEALAHSVEPAQVSLGQYVDIHGAGFVGGDEGGQTLLELTGEFVADGGRGSVRVDSLNLVPEFESGQQVRYLINETDMLAQRIDVRSTTGAFVGHITPVTRFGEEEVVGDSALMKLRFSPVKQVVYLDFKSSYVESLRDFGLRAVDKQIRDRIAFVMMRDFATVNLEVRTEKPEDFALYSTVEIVGKDPNNIGFLGYDNSPGKDRDNMRLFDRIGGVNAETQADGFPGYGGVFIQSLFAFSKHPGEFAKSVPNADAAFDLIFDPFRPDRGGEPVVAADLSIPVTRLGNGARCPSKERSDQISCAVFVLGNLIGTTLSHEVGHSLGLANPRGEAFHNFGDVRNRLMDAGGNRPFIERAELLGEGPARFCTSEYEYLRRILPSSTPADTTPRPSCR